MAGGNVVRWLLLVDAGYMDQSACTMLFRALVGVGVGEWSGWDDAVRSSWVTPSLQSQPGLVWCLENNYGERYCERLSSLLFVLVLIFQNDSPSPKAHLHPSSQHFPPPSLRSPQSDQLSSRFVAVWYSLAQTDYRPMSSSISCILQLRLNAARVSCMRPESTFSTQNWLRLEFFSAPYEKSFATDF